MTSLDRRRFLSNAGLGAATGALVLPAYIAATEASGIAGDYGRVYGAELKSQVAAIAIPEAKPPAPLKPTEDNILGPFYRKRAPFRAKITPPLEPGDPLVVRGRVWGADTRRPLANAVLDIWQANAKGRYDNDDPQNQPKSGVFVNRARIAVDETGYYEYETIKPGRYQIGPNVWRPAHVHYMIACPGYKTLVTQMYFKGDPMNDRDRFIKKSLIIDPEVVAGAGGKYLLGAFDIVLAKA